MVNFLLKTNDGKDRKPHFLFMQLGVLAMLWPKLSSATGESHHLAFLGNWSTIIRTLLALSTYCHWMSSPSRK